MQGAATPASEPSVRFLNPAWFTSVMGTGVVAVALGQFGQQLVWLEPVAWAAYLLSLLMLAGLLALWMLKVWRHPQAVLADLNHPQFSQLFPTLPIALLVTALATRQIGPALLGENLAVPLAQGLYLLGSPLIFLFSVGVAFVIFTRLEVPLKEASGVWFIPPVSALVVPLVGGVLLADFPRALHRELLVWNGIFLGIGLLLFIFVLSTLLQRLYAFGRPSPHMLPSVWIGLAPVGLGILAPWRWLEGGARVGLLPEGWSEALPFVGVALWGLGLWWFTLSLMFLLDVLWSRHSCERLQFTPGWWSFVFPLGTFTLSTLALSRALESGLLLLAAWGLFAALMGFWLVVLARSVLAWTGLKPLLPAGS